MVFFNNKNKTKFVTPTAVAAKQQQQREIEQFGKQLQTKKKVRRSPVKFHYVFFLFLSFLLLLLELQTYNLPEMILNFRISFLTLVGEYPWHLFLHCVHFQFIQNVLYGGLFHCIVGEMWRLVK